MKKSTLAVATLLTALSAMPLTSVAYADDAAPAANAAPASNCAAACKEGCKGCCKGNCAGCAGNKGE